jgi:xanthine dehydrogenase YagS FAD-binding subunit
MLPFDYAKAKNENDAMDRVRARKAAFVAGGTTLIDLMKLNVMLPAMLVDINGLPLDKIEALPDGSLRIGAMVRNSDMAHHAEVIKRFLYFHRRCWPARHHSCATWPPPEAT